MRPARHAWAIALLCSLGCEPPAGATEEGPAPTLAGEDERGRSIRGAAPAGSTCSGRDDCASDQVCVGSVCRYRVTSRAGAVLAAGARGQMEAGDASGAVRSYDQAIDAYEAASAPVPPAVACGAAAAALRAAGDAETREKAARLADLCFRSSLPGDHARLAVETGIARLRFDGLDISAFDRSEPADRFFTEQPSRPTADAIEIALDLAERDNPGYSQLSELLRSEPAQRAISDCFIQDWEINHERSAEASLVLKFQTSMRDMGDYDTFVARVEVVHTSLAEDGFEPCVARALTEALQPGPRMGRSISAWQEPFAVAARVH